MNIDYIQDKVSKVRKSCVTAEHRAAYKRFYELYKQRVELYNNDFKYRLEVDMWLLLGTSFLIACGFVVGLLALITKLLND